MQTVMLIPFQQKLITNCCYMGRKLFVFLLFSLFGFYSSSFAQEDPVEVDSVALQKRIDSEFNALKEWRDSLARAKGLSLPNEENKTQSYPASELPVSEQLKESQEKLSQFKKIIIYLFVLVMVVGVLLSKPWKKKEKNIP